MDVDEDDAPVLVNVETTLRQASSPSSRLQSLSLVKVPLTLVTGYLGAGKTTLVNYILREQHGKKIAVILNEFGDSADIEKALTVNKNGEQVEEWLELANGCICCSVKDSGVAAIESLIERRGSFDYILLETTGLADPGNIAPLFWVDDGLGSSIYLDGIVTLVDAKNILLSLDEEPPEGEDVEGLHMTIAHLQISHADVLIINKSDVVTPQQLEAVVQRVQSVNGLAKIHKTSYGQIPYLEDYLLDIHAYDGLGSLDVAAKGHSHLDPSISTISIALPPLSPPQLQFLDSWLRSILWESLLPLPDSSPSSFAPHIFSIHRLKGRIRTTFGTTKMLQGVRDVFEIVDIDDNMAAAETENTAKERQLGKIVLIGRGVAEFPWEENLLFWLHDFPENRDTEIGLFGS
ncbi:hypothetical protein MMC12_002416 [Toensbergia leucococca]|nr:hypothetical protein [Toensbergia leucococca]